MSSLLGVVANKAAGQIGGGAAQGGIAQAAGSVLGSLPESVPAGVMGPAAPGTGLLGGMAHATTGAPLAGGGFGSALGQVLGTAQNIRSGPGALAGQLMRETGVGLPQTQGVQQATEVLRRLGLNVPQGRQQPPRYLDLLTPLRYR